MSNTIRYVCPECKEDTDLILVETTTVEYPGQFSVDEEGHPYWDDDLEGKPIIDFDECDFETFRCNACNCDFTDPLKIFIENEESTGN